MRNTDRTDPLESSARVLAAAAGHDPDARVPKPGTERTMPLWCTYRDAARKQRALEQTEVVASTVIARPEGAAEPPLTIVGLHEAATIAQMKTCMRFGNVVAGALCADGHVGYAQPVGAVIAYEGQVSISGVGFDIACGNMAVRLDTPYVATKESAAAILAHVRNAISFGVGRKNETPVEHALFDDTEAWAASGMEDYRAKALAQLGTVGSGNHYVDLFEDDDGFVWIGVHFGSRGLGHTAATRWLKAAGGTDGMHVAPTVVDEDSEIGHRYIAAMELAGRYAYAGRAWVVERVRAIIGGAVTASVHNHHNFAWHETHHGRSVWVVRKGATPAFPGQTGFVGGSMGDDAVILEGAEGGAADGLLHATVHGAGRLFGRRQALKTFKREEMDGWLRRRCVLLSGGDLDESPMAYRRLDDVLAAHAGTILVKHRLRPFAVAMAGEGEFDPFKD